MSASLPDQSLLMKFLKSRLLLLTVVMSLCSTLAYEQEKNSSQKIAEFLKTDREVKTETNEWRFTGKFIAVPEQLQNDLLNSYPKHRFSLVEMGFCGHPPCHSYPLIIITDSQTGEVVSFIRHLNWGIAAKSFNHLFDIYQAESQEDIGNKLVALGKLIALTDERGSLGRVKQKKNIVSVELFWGDGVWRRLEMKSNSKFQIKGMTLLNASKYRGFF